LICDLHIHSNFSDSSRNIQEVIDLAKNNSIDVISIVDHDTVETFEYIKNLKNKDKVIFIPGIEISAFDYKRNRKVHLLAYGYDKADNIKKICQRNLDNRNENSEKQLKIIREKDFLIDENVAHSVNSKKTLYKQHIMRALTESEFDSKEYQNLYKALFKNGGIADFSFDYVDIYEALDAVLEDGAIPVLAHPGETNSFEIAEDLVKKGLKGIEVFHSSHSESDVKRSREIAKKYDLIITGGSDDHGIYGKKVKLGDINLDPEIVKKLNYKNMR
jgi:predicted metal-dependent phosphoesterase TrpH